MAKITVEEERPVGALAELTYRLIAEDEHRQRFLPESFSGLSGQVVPGSREPAR